MSHLLYLIFRCDFDVMESLKSLEKFGRSKHTPSVQIDGNMSEREIWLIQSLVWKRSTPTLINKAIIIYSL